MVLATHTASSFFEHDAAFLSLSYRLLCWSPRYVQTTPAAAAALRPGRALHPKLLHMAARLQA
jgi:hypothetical protein